jgi:hypothetical protein
MIHSNRFFTIGCFLWISVASTFAFSIKMSKEIYGIPNSGWTAKEWNWGSAMGTGHDCALICRRQYGSRQARAELVSDLLESKGPPFEEVKLVLGLAWQRGRWDGSDGGLGGYGDVLSEMAKAKRYEVGDKCDKLLIADMKERYHLLNPTDADKEAMVTILDDIDDIDASRRKCSGLVLKSMGFIDSGL